MLVLSRKAGELIHIGNDVTIEVRRVAGNRVALAVQAPRDVRILRGELKESANDFEEETSPATLSMLLTDMGCTTAASA